MFLQPEIVGVAKKIKISQPVLDRQTSNIISLQTDKKRKPMPTFHLDIFLLGCFGGLLPDVLRFVKNRYEKVEGFYRYPSYWIGLFFLIALGGLGAWFSGATEFKNALAFGYAAPEMISKLLSASGSKPDAPHAAAPGAGVAPKVMGGQQPAPEFDLLRWWKS